MPNPYHDPKNGQFTTKRGASGFSPSRGMGSDAKAVADRMQKNGTSKVFPQSRGSRVIANRSSRGVDLYAQTTSEYNARLAKNRVELSKKINREAGRTPKPKGWSANELKSLRTKMRQDDKNGPSAKWKTSPGVDSRQRLAVVRSERQAAAKTIYDPQGKRAAQLSRVRDGIERRSRSAYGKLNVHSSPAKVKAITDKTNTRLANVRKNKDKLFEQALSAKGSDKRRDTFKGSNSLSGGTPVGWNQRNSITNKAAVARAAKYDSASPFYVTKNKTGKIKIKGSGEFSWMKQ